MVKTQKRKHSKKGIRKNKTQIGRGAGSSRPKHSKKEIMRAMQEHKQEHNPEVNKAYQLELERKRQLKLDNEAEYIEAGEFSNNTTNNVLKEKKNYRIPIFYKGRIIYDEYRDPVVMESRKVPRLEYLHHHLRKLYESIKFYAEDLPAMQLNSSNYDLLHARKKDVLQGTLKRLYKLREDIEEEIKKETEKLKKNKNGPTNSTA
jgi:hypothetical protein